MYADKILGDFVNYTMSCSLGEIRFTGCQKLSDMLGEPSIFLFQYFKAFRPMAFWILLRLIHDALVIAVFVVPNHSK